MTQSTRDGSFAGIRRAGIGLLVAGFFLGLFFPPVGGLLLLIGLVLLIVGLTA